MSLKNMLKAAAMVAAVTFGLAVSVSCEKEVKKEEPVEVVLKSRLKKFHFKFQPGTLTTIITTTAASWEAQSNYSWLNVEKNASEEDALDVTVDENVTDQPREGHISIIALDAVGKQVKSITLPVVQDAKSGVVAGNILFEDPEFEKIMVETYDGDGDGYLSEEEALDIREIELESLGLITSVKGIEYFKNLEFLDISDNKLTKLDVSGLPKLKYVHFNLNKVESFRCEDCPLLQSVMGRSNRLKVVNLKPISSSLQVLDLMKNELSSLDVSGMDKLQYVAVGRNNLAELNVSGCSQISFLTCQDNKLSALDVSDVSKLLSLDCSNNYIAELDVTKNKELGILNIAGNRIRNIDLSGCPMMNALNVSNTQVASLDFSKNPDVEVIRCSTSKITALSLKGLAGLHVLECNELDLSAGLDLSGNAQLQKLYCNRSGLTSLDLQGKKELDTVELNDNSIPTLDLSGSGKLVSVKVKGNNMTSLILPKSLEGNASFTLEKDGACQVTYR